jgi:hypothetical protein
MRKINIQGKEIELHEVEPLNSSEKWNEYQMPNGDILKIKLIMTRIFTSSAEKLPNGNYPYNFDFKAVAEVIPVEKEVK